MKIENLANSVFDFILSVIISFSYTYALATSFHKDLKPLFFLCFITLITMQYSIIFCNRFYMKISAIIITLAMLVSAIFLAVQGTLEEFLNNIYLFVGWIYTFALGISQFNHVYSMYFSILLCAVVSLYCFLCTCKKFNFLCILSFGLLIFTIQWSCHVFVSYLSFYIFIITILVYYTKHIYIMNTIINLNESSSKNIFSFYLIPVGILVFTLALAIPAKPDPIQWEWLDKKINTFYNYCKNNFIYNSPEYFSLSSSGFGNTDSHLGSKVRLDNTLVMVVNSPRPIYLRGAIKDTYTGVSWIESTSTKLPLSNDNDVPGYDLFETLNALHLLSMGNENIFKYFDYDTINITYEKLKSKSIFIPCNSYRISTLENFSENLFVSSNGTVTSEKLLLPKFNYNITVYNPKYNNEGFKKLIRKSHIGLYNEVITKGIDTLYKEFLENMNSSNQEQLTFSISQYSMSVFSQNAKLAYSRYLQLPESFPLRIKELAMSITKSKENSYDKVKAIEDYLSTNYPYNLNVDAVPKERDFVDYFLFDSREGYCTYFSSAMAVMVRSIGIPARYIEGYILPSTPKFGTTYEVTNERAHAWVEVYFEGYGWLPFEPTSAFNSTFYNTTSKAKFSSDLLDDPYYLQYIKGLNVNASNVLNASDTENSPKKTNNSNNLIIYSIVAISTILIVLSIILINFLRRKLKISRFNKMQPKDFVLNYYKYCITLLKLLDYTILPGETPSEFAKRVDRLLYFSPISFKSVTDIFIKVRYGNLDVDYNEKAAIIKFFEILNNTILEKFSKPKYLICKYMLGRL